MKRFNLLLIVFCFTLKMDAQDKISIDSLDNLISILFKEKKACKALTLMESYNGTFDIDNGDDDYYRQMMGTYYSFFAKEKEAVGLFSLPTFKYNSLLKKEENAVSKIVKIAEKEQLLIFNEAHHIPSHRLFIMNLLKPLRKKGYNVIALEALAQDNKLTICPTIQNGYYLQEQCLAWLIRYAISLGYEIYPYEFVNKASIDGKEQLQSREAEQALNISQIVKKHKNEKVIVLAGWDHNIEKEAMDGNKRMAQILKEKYEINPYTISQTFTTSKKLKYDFSTHDINFFDSCAVDLVVFNNHNFNSFAYLKPFYNTKKYDININEIDGTNKIIHIQINDTNEKDLYPQAFLPVFQTIINKNKKYKIYLPKNRNYEIILRNANDDILSVQKFSL
jgi:hypothetical protein